MPSGNGNASGIVRAVWQAQAEPLKIHPPQDQISGAPTYTFLTEVEAEDPAQAQSARRPAKADTLKGDGLIEELQVALLAGGPADTDGDLAGAQAVEPKPAEQEQDQEGEEAVHGWILL